MIGTLCQRAGFPVFWSALQSTLPHWPQVLDRAKAEGLEPMHVTWLTLLDSTRHLQRPDAALQVCTCRMIEGIQMCV